MGKAIVWGICLVAVLGLFGRSSWALDCFEEDFTAFVDWTYTPGSEGLFASTGTHAYVDDWQSGSLTQADKPLVFTITPVEDFTFEMDVRVAPDFSGRVGGVHAQLLDAQGQIVADMGWHDAQAATGYGGVDFYAEAQSPIYRTDPSGFGTEYPDFDGTLTLKREGTEWTAWVNGVAKGSPLDFPPTLTATTARIEITRSVSWPDAGVEIDEVRASSKAKPSSLYWQPDEGVRVTGPDGCVAPTHVRQVSEDSYGMYFYDGNGTSFGDTGYATSTDGADWTYEGRVMLHEPGGPAFDNMDAVIEDVVVLSDNTLRAYCRGLETNQGNAPTAIFYADSDDGLVGQSWTKREVLFEGNHNEGQVGCSRVFGSEQTGYTMYFNRGQQVMKSTSADGVNWDPEVRVVSDLVGGFDIAEVPTGGFRMFVGSGGDIASLFSPDGDDWQWDTGTRLEADDYGQSSLGAPVVAEIDGVGL